jgi:phage gpG-like protein
MLRLEIEGSEALRRRLRGLESGLAANTVTALKSSAARVHREASTNLSGSVLKVVTGHLKGSVTPRVDAARGEAIVGTKLVYGPVHEYGATIRPKRAEYLWFPVAGRGIRISRAAAKSGKWTRSAKLEGGGRITLTGEVHWVRARKVTIPPRPWLGTAFAASRAYIIEQFRAAIERTLQGRR